MKSVLHRVATRRVYTVYTVSDVYTVYTRIYSIYVEFLKNDLVFTMFVLLIAIIQSNQIVGIRNLSYGLGISTDFIRFSLTMAYGISRNIAFWLSKI